MKKSSLIIIIISSLGIIISQVISLVNANIFSQRLLAVSLIGLGVGAILFGIYLIKNPNQKR